MATARARTGRGWPMLLGSAQVRERAARGEGEHHGGWTGRQAGVRHLSHLLVCYVCTAQARCRSGRRRRATSVCAVSDEEAIGFTSVSRVRDAECVLSPNTGGHGGQRHGAGGARPLVRLPRAAAAQQTQEDSQEPRSGGAKPDQQPATGGPRHGAHRAGVSRGRRDHRVRRPTQRHPH